MRHFLESEVIDDTDQKKNHLGNYVLIHLMQLRLCRNSVPREAIPPEHHLLSHLALMLSGKPGSYKLLIIVSWCSSLVHQFSLWFSSNSALCRLIMFILIKLLFIKLLHPSIPPLCLCVQLCWCLCISRTHPRFPPFGFHTPFLCNHVILLKLLFKDVS